MFNKYGIINSTAKGTKVDNVAFSKMKIHPVRIAFFHALGYFQTSRETGMEKSHLLPKEETSST